MKLRLVSHADHAALEALRALQAKLSRYDLAALRQRETHWRKDLELARKRMQEFYHAQLEGKSEEERESWQRAATNTMVFRGYDLAAEFGSPLDSPLHLVELYDVWEDMEKGLHSTAEAFGDREVNVILSTALHHSHNARTFVLEESGHHVILFHDRMLSFLDELSALFTYAASSTADEAFKDRFSCLGPGTFREQLQGNREFDRALNAFFLRHAIDEWSQEGKTVSRSGAHRTDVAYQVYLCMRFFVMGHEFAHLLLGHTDQRRFWSALSESKQSAGQVRVSEAERGPEQELEADVVGLEIGMNAAFENRIDLQIYFWAAQLFFYGNEWLSLYRQLEEGAQDQSSGDADLAELVDFETHPPLEKRRTVIVDAIGQLRRTRPGVPDHYDTQVPMVLHAEVERRIREAFH